MIYFQRGPCPKILSGNRKKGTHYNHPEVVQSLRKMQHKKCCYCEQYIHEEGHGKEVEHFRPQSFFPELKNDWKNLFLACSSCNGKKSNRFPVFSSKTSSSMKVEFLKEASDKEPAMINPTEINPADHLTFDFSGNKTDEDFGIIREKERSLLGKYTIKTVKLDSKDYTERRYQHYIYTLMPSFYQLLVAKEQDNTQHFENCKKIFQLLVQPEAPFAAFSRAFTKHNRLDKPPINIHIPKIS